MNTTINNYSIAIAEGNKINVTAILTASANVMPPASNQPIESDKKQINIFMFKLAFAIYPLLSFLLIIFPILCTIYSTIDLRL